MFKKRAQAAMEFLMTYGWAILVVLVAIGALAYFGVLSPDKFLPERCTGTSGMDCLDKASITADDTNGVVKFAFKNNLGQNINITGVISATSGSDDCEPSAVTASVEGEAEVTIGPDADDTHNSVLVNNGQNVVMKYTCDDAVSEGRFKAELKVPYKMVDTGLDHVASYSIAGKAI